MLRLLLAASAALFAETVNFPAPDVSVKMEDGRVVKLSSFKGKPLFVEVFSTTCPACQAMAPIVEKSFRQYQSKGLQVLAVINDESQRNDFARFRKQYGATYPMGYITRDDCYKLFNQSMMRPFGVPACLFIDRNGIVREKHNGVMDLVTLPRSIEALLRR